MAERWAVNLLLLVLVALLAAAVRHDLESAKMDVVLTGLDPRQITRVAIERPGKPAIRLVRAPQGWQMEEPFKVAADGGRTEQLLRIAATPIHRSLPATARPELLGLAPARVRLTLDGLALRFGDTDPVGHRRYVAIGDQIHLIDDGFALHLTAPATAYVSRRLLPEGFRPVAGTIDGQSLSATALDGLSDLEATQVVPPEEELSGRLLSLRTGDEKSAIRFLVSADGRRWTRVDLHLSYLLATTPALDVAATAPAASEPSTRQ
jgi:hypothetical protein